MSSNKFFFCKWAFHAEHLDELLTTSNVGIVVDDVYHTVPNSVGDIHSDAFSNESMMALLVYYGTLFVHYVVIFEQTFTYTEVVFLDFLLCTFNTL